MPVSQVSFYDNLSPVRLIIRQSLIYFLIKGMQMCWIEDLCLFSIADNSKNWKYKNDSQQTLLLKIHWTSFDPSWHKAPIGKRDSRLFKSILGQYTSLLEDNQKLVDILFSP